MKSCKLRPKKVYNMGHRSLIFSLNCFAKFNLYCTQYMVGSSGFKFVWKTFVLALVDEKIELLNFYFQQSMSFAISMQPSIIFKFKYGRLKT